MAFGGVRGLSLRDSERIDGKRTGKDVGGQRRPGGVSRPPYRPAPRPSAFPELDCIRGLLPERVIVAAERRAHAIGVGADRVLIAADAITEEAYLKALAAFLGTVYEPLDRVSRADCPLDDEQLIQAAATGLLPLRQGDELTWIVAPRHLTARRLAGQRWANRPLLRSFRLTSCERLRRFAARHAYRTLGRRAADGLQRTWPLFSNAPRARGAWRIAGVALALAGIALVPLAPAGTVDILGMVLCALFLASAGLRLASVSFARRAPPRSGRYGDDRLPIYTIICALYREADVVGDLVAAIRALDYPQEKLDVKIVVEEDDAETGDALARLDLGAAFEIIAAPPIGPRTKPKALNVALPFARGAFSVVYDAEDLPEPDQLRRALDTFIAGDERLACVQASLTIDNTVDNWLARMFTADYAGQFDVFLPGLAALRLPLPLGGSSNHFRTEVLRNVGGWDPFNVTEDADLGIRLCRLGYRSAASSSATYEEAPARFVPWLKQRTRWYKGWMQTWLVHMRQPGRLLRELGPLGVLTFQLLMAGNVVSALVHPLFLAWLGYEILGTPQLSFAEAADYAVPIFIIALICGYAATIVPDAVGLRRRGLLAHAWVLVLTPVYWLLLSLAAWRALFQLLYDPQRWEKTEHGVARTSRLST